MPRKAYIGVDGVARRIKKGYVGIDGVARRIKKAYVGIGGVARPCWGGELKYYGKITSLTVARYELAATTVGDYALFGGGTGTDGYTVGTVDAYNKSLTRTTPTSLSTARESLAATTVGDYALFGGGYEYAASYNQRYSGVVDVYDKSLTRITPSESIVARVYPAATTVGDYALFGGGNGTYESDTVEAYDKSLTKTKPSALYESRTRLAATTVGDYALFSGGITKGTSSSNTVRSSTEAYNKSLTRTTATSLSFTSYRFAATTVGDYALFGGGYRYENDTPLNTVNAYNKSLTRTTAKSLTVARRELAATTVGNYALFGGGSYSSTYNTVDAYNDELTRTTPTSLSVAREYLAATTVGDYALFGGGTVAGNDSDAKTTVDAYVGY